MIPRPFACDGDDCDYTEHGAWRHAEGCLYRETAEYGYGRVDVLRDALAADGYSLSSKGYCSLPVPQQREAGEAA